MDDEIPIFRIHITEENFNELIKNAQTSINMGDIGDLGDFGDKGDMGKGSLNIFGEKYTINNATMIVEINGKKESFNSVKFSIGGSSSRIYGRQAFNLKIKDKKKDLYGRKQFRIRSDAREATYLRSKLSCDMHNRLNLLSIAANYMLLYINDQYFGIYIIMDAPKESWAKLEFNDENSKNLYKCKNGGAILSGISTANTCKNENDKITENSEWLEFLDRVEKAQSPDEIEDIFDIDQFLYELVFEYLTGSWDHFLNAAHNFSMYKNPKNGKWTIIYYDFDADIGQDVYSIEMDLNPSSNDNDHNKPNVKDYIECTFKEWANKPPQWTNQSRHILDLLVFNNTTRFDNILQKFVKEVFNPSTLYPHIDELKKFIKPHILKDKTPNENGKCPGVINEFGSDYTFEQWDANSEFTSISGSFGIKYWILAKYRYICKSYGMECDPIYMDENYNYPVNKEIEGNPLDSWITNNKNNNNDNNDNINNNNINNNINNNGDDDKNDKDKDDINPSQSSEPGKKEEPVYKCWSELIGYPCCSEGNNMVYGHDDYGDWSYDFQKNIWCGLDAYHEPINDEECWSEIFGYPCCKSCVVYEEEEEYGKWGYENNQWCGIQSFCNSSK
ncbi:hypothetical protein BCR32DRAFT_225628 [Anaeromyces robustus]|uniref:CBM10 domain-containing protein n=1 Tax=Anaeromyces robustus TaxID=1754192 RepID=A0A1Y1WA36_9FUNG|nr:hypothetical protein BCR32DRAFT_225628 [Anaeromyces robustus]|eukprot:ORX70407.1 hypothetical protein BCR32DRAFT_225628 [Anaeromyces robustus]